MSLLIIVSAVVFVLSTGACYGLIAWMRRRSVGQHIREQGPKGHLIKSGTPTMGGIVFLALWALALLGLWMGRLHGGATGFVLAAGLLSGGIGLLDDLLSLRRRRSEGLTGRQKIVLSTVAAVILFFTFRQWIDLPQAVPFSHLHVALPLPASFALAWIVFVATPNSVNLTDGLDGLAAGASLLILVGLLIMQPSLENAVWISPLLAALCGFLLYNTHPARLFMGDVGAYALGGIIAAIVLANGTALMLPLLGGIVVLESVSVILQVGGAKLTGRRLLKMAPLHHHFERHPSPRTHILRGFEWPEPTITRRFLLVQSAFVALALLASIPFR